MPKKKEDRSDWVAVAPDTTSTSTGTSTKIKPATSAYQFFQKQVTPSVKEELKRLYGSFDVGTFSRMVREKWNALDEHEKHPFEEMARDDQARFARESHAADIAALERREKLQKERQQAFLYDSDDDDDDDDDDEDDDDDDDDEYTERKTKKRPLRRKATRGHVKQLEQQRQRKERKKRRRQESRLSKADEEEFQEESSDEDDDDDSNDSYHSSLEESDEDDSDDDEDEEDDSLDSSGQPRRKPKKKKKKKTPKKPKTTNTSKTKKKQPPVVASQKQLEYRQKLQQEKKEKEEYIESRQEELRKEKANQAKRRLEFLLKQSNIFSHFGQVKEDQAKYGIKTTTTTSTKSTAVVSRRSDRMSYVDEDDTNDANNNGDQKELDEADEHQATFLTSQPTTLAFGQMRQYQLEGLNWMIRLQEHGVNGILADEMGLGKTLQSISILVYMLEYQHCTGPHLVVVPKSTLSNWMGELARWAPTLTPIKFHGNKESRDDIANNVLCPGQNDQDRTWQVCVTTYEVCNIEKNVLNKFAWQYLIIDEAHRLKNEASAFSKTVRSFETRYRILLTGTPLQNSLHELWALLNFLVPDVFASAEQFDDWFNLDIEDNDEKNRLISQLHKILRPFMLRRLKKEVEKSLPPKHETILFTGMSVMQKKLYRDILIRDIDALRGSGGSGNRTAILNIVMQLRKCAGHPYLFPGVEDRSLPPLGEHLVENCGKMVLLDKLLKRLKERGHRVLLFTQMTRVLDIMEDYLVMRRFKYCRIDGNTSYEQREDFIEAFNAPNSEKFLFLLSTRAGGLGINLQTADVVILYDSDWNPQADLQAQDRAHRIGQKREVQVFRLVTEHTVEEKIVERAQQKLKLDAMVVQQGRLKEKDKLSRDELLEAVRFGADKIFKSKDSSITDEDIDMILNAGKRKTQELNEKLMQADKGDLLDFKLDGSTSNLQTFEGVDYSNSGALAAAKAEAELMGIIDMGKRERRTVANYNENKLYQQQMAAINGKDNKQPKKKKVIRLPKDLRLPRMEEWQMFDRARLWEIQEMEEKKFRELPEEIQKMATMKKQDSVKDSLQADDTAVKKEEDSPTKANESRDEGDTVADAVGSDGAVTSSDAVVEPVKLPPLLDEETQAEKERLLSEGFVSWSRVNFSAFVKESARYGRTNIPKIAAAIGKTEQEVQEFASAFWGDVGKKQISEHEYDRVVKLIERGERKIGEIKSLQRGTRVLISLFDNPWEELEFTHVNTKDKLFSAENDRYLLCWSHKYGYGQWGAIKMAVRRSPKFRFDYFLRSLPVEIMGRRCEHLMKAAEKEIEHLEKKAREDAGLPTVPPEDGGELPPVHLPSFRVMQKQRRLAKIAQTDQEKRQLSEKVEEIEASMKQIQDRLKELNKDPSEEYREIPVLSRNNSDHRNVRKRPRTNNHNEPAVEESHDTTMQAESVDETRGAIGPEGTFVEFPEYDGVEPPKEPKKAFTHFCNTTRREIKSSLAASERKNKGLVNDMLRDRWLELPDDSKSVWRKWASWDKKRYMRDLNIYEQKGKGSDSTAAVGNDQEQENAQEDTMKTIHVPKKRSSSFANEGGAGAGSPLLSIPKKKKKRSST